MENDIFSLRGLDCKALDKLLEKKYSEDEYKEDALPYRSMVYSLVYFYYSNKELEKAHSAAREILGSGKVCEPLKDFGIDLAKEYRETRHNWKEFENYRKETNMAQQALQMTKISLSEQRKSNKRMWIVSLLSIGVAILSIISSSALYIIFPPT